MLIRWILIQTSCNDHATDTVKQQCFAAITQVNLCVACTSS